MRMVRLKITQLFAWRYALCPVVISQHLQCRNTTNRFSSAKCDVFISCLLYWFQHHDKKIYIFFLFFFLVKQITAESGFMCRCRTDHITVHITVRHRIWNLQHWKKDPFSKVYNLNMTINIYFMHLYHTFRVNHRTKQCCDKGKKWLCV